MKFLILMLLLPSLAACTSLYSRSYTQLIDPSTVAQAPKAPTPQAVIMVRSENLQKDVQSMREKMYVPIGYSSFSGEPESEEVLIGFAERIGASAVLLSSTFTLSISYAEAKAGGAGADVRGPQSQKPLQDRFEHTAVFMVRSIEKPRFGVQMRDLRDDERMPPIGRLGAVIDFVVEDTPASRGKLLSGDVIVTARDVGVRNAAHFQEIIAALPKGEPGLSLTLIRSGKAQQVLIKF